MTGDLHIGLDSRCKGWFALVPPRFLADNTSSLYTFLSFLGIKELSWEIKKENSRKEIKLRTLNIDSEKNRIKLWTA